MICDRYFYLCLMLLGTPASAELPDRALVYSVCAQISDSATRNDILGEQSELVDINNDGAMESVKSSRQGTMNFQHVDYVDVAGNTLNIDRIGFEWKTYWTAYEQSFAYLGDTFRVYYGFEEDLSHVTYTTPANTEHVLCEYQTHVIERNLPGEQRGPAYSCEDARARSNRYWRIRSLEHGTSLTYKQLNKFGFYNSSAQRKGWINIDNDPSGNLEPVVEVQYASGAGRGCDTRFYLLTDETHSEIVHGELQGLLLEAQGIYLSGGKYHPGCVGGANVLMESQNHLSIALDVRTSWRTRELRDIVLGKVRTVCKYESEYVSEIYRIYPYNKSKK